LLKNKLFGFTFTKNGYTIRSMKTKG